MYKVLPYRFLKIGLSAVFLWSGIDKFFNPDYWLAAWVPSWLLFIGNKLSIGDPQLIYLIGAFEILIGLSLLIGVFTRSFSFLGAAFIILILISAGINGATIKDLGLVAALLAIAYWPKRRLSGA